MEAWVLTAHGDPQKVLQLRSWPEPVPGPGQVQVSAEGFGLNFADVMAVRGAYRAAPAPPSVLGYEVVGRISAVGEGVDKGMIGKRVTAITRFGGYARVAVTDHRAVMPVPEEMPLGVAAALATQGSTAWYMARVARPLYAGDRVLVRSAAGGVGQLLVQAARAQGCEVVAVASGARKMAYLEGLGAHRVIDRSAQRDQLHGEEFDAIFNAVGGSTFKPDLAALRAGGALLLYGGAQRSGGSGTLGTLRFVWHMGLVVPILLMMRSVSILGVNMLGIGDRKPELLQRCLAGSVEDAVQGRWTPAVHAELPATELPAALAMLAGGETIGKVVLRW